MAVDGHEGRPKITADEERLLVGGAPGLRLEDRAVEGLVISSCTFADARLRDVVFRDCRFTQVVFDDARFENVRFETCELLQVDFRRSIWSSSSAYGMVTTGARFSACRLVASELATCTFKDATLEASELDALRITDGLFVEVQITGTKLIGCDLVQTRFDRPIITGVTISGGSLSGVLLSAGVTRGLHVLAASVDVMNIVLGDHAGLTFEGISGQSIRLTDAQVRGLSFLDGQALADVSVSGGTVDGMAVMRWQALSMFMIGHARVNNLIIDAAAITGLYLRKATLVGSAWSTAVLTGVDLEQSSIDGMALAGVRFATLLRVPQARINGLSLQGVAYENGLEVHDDGVAYGPGDRFPQGGG